MLFNNAERNVLYNRSFDRTVVTVLKLSTNQTEAFESLLLKKKMFSTIFVKGLKQDICIKQHTHKVTKLKVRKHVIKG